MNHPSKASLLGVDHLPTTHTIALSNRSCTRYLLASYPRKHFARSALFTALASSLGLVITMTPAMAADNANSNINSNANNIVKSDASLTTKADIDDDTVLDALRLKNAVEKGIIDRSVLEEYNQQNINNNGKGNSTTRNEAISNNSDSINAGNETALSEQQLQQQAQQIQRSGYQMMTPEQIESELAALDILDNQQDAVSNDYNNDSDNSGFDSSLNDDIFTSGNDFDAPIATLDSAQPPIGFDSELDQASLPTPSNLETLNMPQDQQDVEEVAEIMARPIQVSDAVSSGQVDPSADITQQARPEQALAQQQGKPVTDAGNQTQDIQAQAGAGRVPDIVDNGDQATPDNTLDPDDYLPEYQVATDEQALSEGVEQANKPKLSARNSESLVKRAYNKLFNGGVVALPHVETTVYLQQAATDKNGVSTTTLIKADKDIQPINNIKAALDDTTVQSVVDFTAALPRLRQSALDAARAVGYYDISLKLRQSNSDTIDVIIEKLGEPVRVDSRIVDIRGAGIEQPEFKELEAKLAPQEGDIFNHRVYKNSKAALESLSNTYGYFDQYWLNKSVDVILPDNTADVSLVYNTGDRYEFDEVVFFTYDKATNTLTRDPAKLPVELSLLQQMFDFEAGDPFYRPSITKFGNDLSATRYFNTVNVESILPADARSAASTLAFDNVPANSESDLDPDVDSDQTISNSNNSSNDNSNATLGQASSADNTTDENAGTGTGTVIAGSASSDNAAIGDPADIAPIEFEVDEQTSEKLQAIKQKATRLIQLPNNRVLDEKEEEAQNFLGKISDSISNVVKKIIPDEERAFRDENFVPPTLEGRITPAQVKENKKVPLYVFVSSDKPRDAQVGLGYGTDTGVRATGKIDYNLINRQGYQAGAEVELSRITKNATVYGSRPWKHPLNDKIEARLTYEEEVIDKGESTFDLSTQTLKAALARNIRKDSGWNSSYFVNYRLDKLESGVDEIDLQDTPIEFIFSKPTQQALLFGYGINKTDVNNVINPTSGIRQYYSIEGGTESLATDTDMAIVRAGVSGLYSFGEDNKHQLLGSFNTGYIWADDFDSVPYKLRFFAGGDRSIRGYDYESLSPVFESPLTDKSYLTGGQVLAVGSAEYNYEFIPGFRGAVFTDVGNAYDTDFDTETKVGVGVGIRWASPVGTVRVDVAAGVSEESIPVRLHFFIGSPL
ncbi:autotransporter assembly complex family protein [Psychrobacter sp. M13]|uniref:autotransporter assembly complex protein TamA n=1 Tax=Psychrobacter sp. M13 TaxID=3067275 RepID=UPI00273B56E0|nr:BamA/TamA family outer membrane protein [Psychrobacter sp. M13]WLP95394.1 BamA/TamA family outer membrane protein [Psychrobacter sp. M13]